MSLSYLLQPRVCELGKIKIGGLGEERQSQRGGTYRLPRKDDHFTITTLHRVNGNPRGDLIADAGLMEQLRSFADPDGKLRQLPIVVLSDDIEDIMQCAWVWYGGRKVWGRSDGRLVTWFGDPKTMTALKEPVEEEWKPEYANLRAPKKVSGKLVPDPEGAFLFKLHTTFNCVIASNDSRWGGVYKFRTTSRITGEQLYGSLLHIKQLMPGGILRGVPMRLVVRPMQVSPDGKTSTVYVVHCELRGPDLLAIQGQALKLMEGQVHQAERLKQAQLEYKKIIAAPGFEEDDEAAAIREEFHPEPVREESPPTEADPLLDAVGPIDQKQKDDEADCFVADFRKRIGEAKNENDFNGLAAELDDAAFLGSSHTELAKELETARETFEKSGLQASEIPF